MKPSILSRLDLKSLISLTAISLLIGVTSGCTKSPSIQPEEARRAMIGAMNSFNDALKERNVEKITGHLLNSPEFFFYVEGKRQGYDGTVAQVRELFANLKVYESRWDTIQVSILSPDAIAASATFHVILIDMRRVETHLIGEVTCTAVRGVNEWQFLNAHATYQPDTAFYLPSSTGSGRGFNAFDREIPASEEVRSSLEVANRLAAKNELTAIEMAQIYFAEKTVGRSVWGPTNYRSRSDVDAVIFSQFLDTTLGNQCLRYIRMWRDRFQVVDDHWKGEENFWEPTLYWAEQAEKHFPGSMEAKEIAFDLEFKGFMSGFDIDEDAKGKTCEQYYKDNLENYLDNFSKEEIDTWPSSCESIRRQFIRGRSELLRKYKNAPFTKVLQDIDPTTVVETHSSC
ncbi:MAG: hypothetical protein NTZ35_05735 [Ignavibacteriales bacterium]|nr:hypothetical protein [Ignavibacteriales bacterium]